jgi:hypothetical protein
MTAATPYGRPRPPLRDAATVVNSFAADELTLAFTTGLRVLAPGSARTVDPVLRAWHMASNGCDWRRSRAGEEGFALEQSRGPSGRIS